MLKIFTTQLTGVFKKIAEKEEFSFEDGARLLAQASAGNGSIYLYSAKEMKAVEHEALEGMEPWTTIKPLTPATIDELSDADRVLLFTRTSADEEAVAIARTLREKMIPFVAVSTVMEASEQDLTVLADVHIDLQLKRSLLPDDAGNRYGYPSAMAALFAYHGLKFIMDEILAEFEE